MLAQTGKNKEAASKTNAKNLNNTMLSSYVAGAGVSEPGLNRRPDNMIA